MDDLDDIREYYNAAYDESSRLDRHQLERDMTLRCFAEYLPKEGRVLEIGAAAGVYTLWLAQQGYDVTAVDMSETLFQQCSQRIADAGLEHKVRRVLADARDLSVIDADGFDAVLLMGPLYHLVLREDRISALRQASARLRPGGVFLSALISRFGIMGQLMKDSPHWIEKTSEVRSIMEAGCDPEDAPRGGFRGYFATVEEIGPLHEEVGLETQSLVGVEPAISAEDEIYNSLDGTRRELWLDLLYSLRSEPSLVGSSRHLVYVGHKPVA